MNYLVRFIDQMELEDAKKIEMPFRTESVVDVFLDRWWHEYECPEVPFDVGVREANDSFEPTSEETVYRIGEIDYSPNFYYNEVIPTKTETKTDS